MTQLLIVDREATVDFLLEADRAFLAAVTAHNETFERLCL